MKYFLSSSGMYTSILDIDGNNIDDIKEAIKKVIKSYPDKNIYNEVLVQPMLNKVILSGGFLLEASRWSTILYY